MLITKCSKCPLKILPSNSNWQNDKHYCSIDNSDITEYVTGKYSYYLSSRKTNPRKPNSCIVKELKIICKDGTEINNNALQ